ncbi:hypothetical protein JCM3775_003226 [Rhodotorula graminis]|uniref:Glycosyltransferase family 92 protein n=1 Tax=Rhodotorula graminis (strain WP1) TaxID=578459 RepID=A0A0N8PZU4_RHOGW|nr:uncharacterized protein RHOBADRAFT_55056 [Rhodotorula graminis WP1]KPV73293.1 hypothetical protein RHOBADRAFT_55056 [Rhodotorula graminis WP1]
MVSAALFSQRLRARLWQNRGVLAVVGGLSLLLFVLASPSPPASTSRPPTSTAARAAAAAPLQSSSRPSRRKPSSSGQVVWASTQAGLVQKRLAAPFDDHRATFIHAVVQRENETYRTPGADWQRYVALPLHVEKLPYADPAHQIHSAHLDFVSVAKCTHTFDGEMYETRALSDHADYVYFVRCPIPDELDEELDAVPDGTLKTTLTWVYRDGQGSFNKTFTLEAHYPEPETEFGVCLSPIWAHLDARATLEWRENLRTLGVQAVHWHARDAAVGDFVQRYVDASGAKDTWLYSPPTSLETYGHRDNLADNGLYGDQIIYYLSCKFRSLHTSPSRWLAFIDRDEDFVPKVYPSAALSDDEAAAQLARLLPDYFSTVPEAVGSTCFGKGYHGALIKSVAKRVPAEVAKTQPLELAWIQKLGPPTTSIKCMHRTKAFIHATVHYGEQWYPGYAPVTLENGTEHMSDAVPFRLIHQIPKGGWFSVPKPYTPPYVRDDLEAYLARLWRLREATWDKMGWACSEVPCRFASDE